jgi:cold-inducible RNA-binding protein
MFRGVYHPHWVVKKRKRRLKMNKNLYVGNLSSKVNEDDLRANFSKAGEIVSASVIKDKFTGQSKGFGFVEMATEEGAQEAIKLFSGGMLDGNTIVVNEARPKKDSAGPRSGGRGGFGGGGGRGGFGGGRSGSGGPPRGGGGGSRGGGRY